VLRQAGLLSRWRAKPSRKGAGFEQPLQPHQHWHIDVSYINACGTFYYLCSVLDGYSRSICALGPARINEGGRHRGHSRTRQREVPAGKAAHHLGQRAAVHRPRLQGVHSHLRDDPRAHISVLSVVERKIGTVAQISKNRMHSAAHSADVGRCAPLDSELRGSLQHGASAQRDRLCDTAGYAGGAAAGDSCGA